ncbi:MAG: hypothetical protein [Microvirus sp.]|nr:MAG: hypothetical protein [Microvirus sp.]
MTPIIKTAFNRHLHPKNYEVNTLPSETIPDQNMSIREILSRYARGLPIEQNIPSYQEDEEYNDLPDPRTLDLTERQELDKRIRQELKEMAEKQALQSSEQTPFVPDAEGKATPEGALETA